eukprot:CAMPEP_0201549022 /NCGR_PEP_ID=MMETSP0173_2-20130828/5502_1 /ASSEMBLY_ACC=CAM_ASM_000268 /TAXON_ID=218659 /ORGANISM="Vexillifera sp., Strain DIVA3 564/2" /LENGTH=338 /DNA_ID=CAMNT_0047958559 /DNA_START=116 /DNA_END=1132 /DNA_ORIENTATION=+
MAKQHQMNRIQKGKGASIVQRGGYQQTREEDEHGEFLKEKFSLKPPFPFSGVFSIPNYKYGGHAVVSEEYVRLTPDRQNKRGWIWCTNPSYLKEWEAIIEFQITGQGSHLYGDGMAFWYSNTPQKEGNAFGSVDRWYGLGIMIDSYDNDGDGQNPYLTAIWNENRLSFDPSQDLQNEGVVGGCSLNRIIRNQEGPTRLVVSYSSNAKELTIRVQYPDESWQKCVQAGNLDIKATRPYWFGASAMTGQVADNHDIISMRVYDLEPLISRKGEIKHDHYEHTMPENEDEPQSSFSFLSVLWFIFKWTMILIIIAALALVGYFMFKKYKKIQERKRTNVFN